MAVAFLASQTSQGDLDMTLPVSRLGDKGQRYQVMCRGYPEDGQHVFGWVTCLKSAKRICKSLRKAPGCISTAILDRETNTNVTCDLFECDWVEEYYGHRCGNCDMFYPHGCAPWDDTDDIEELMD